MENVNFEDISRTIENNIDSPVVTVSLVLIALLVLIAIVSIVVQFVLVIKYIKFNRTNNLANISGAEAARYLLDQNDLQHIRVKKLGSFIFGNSYSHYFKKIRLRYLTYNRKSISSLAMAAQKTGLALLDKENDKDMKIRVGLTPLFYFGPVLFLPIVLVGFIVDVLFFGLTGVIILTSTIIAIIYFFSSLFFYIFTLKTEIKAQGIAFALLKDNNLASDNEILLMKKLFKLYNIEYVNLVFMELIDVIIKLLEIFSETYKEVHADK